MSVEDLITRTLHSIRGVFYANRPNEYHRDKKALLKSITRFGYEANQRGWMLEPEMIFVELATVLKKVRSYEADIEYLPAFLEEAVTRSINYRAEELSQINKQINNITGKVLKTLPSGLADDSEAKRSATTSTLAALFSQLNKRKPKPEAKQMRLL